MTRTTVKVLMVLLMGLLILPGCSQELAQPQLQRTLPAGTLDVCR